MKTHWKKAFNSDYLSSSDIDEKDLTLTIKNVIYSECMTQSGKKYCNVAIFKETQLDNKGKCIGGVKPMILNVTNSKIIKEFSGGKTHLEDWLNIKITVYVDGNVRFGKDTVEGLRIRPIKPIVRQNLTPLTSDKLNDAVKYILSGKTIGDLKKRYSMTSEIESKLNTKLNEANI